MAKKKTPSTSPAVSAPKKKAVATKASGKRGVRYTDAKKAKILQFVQDHDQINGRGGQSAAVKKYGVSAITISNWGKKGAAKPKAKTGPKTHTSSGRATDTAGKLQRMLEIQKELEALRREFDTLKAAL